MPDITNIHYFKTRAEALAWIGGVEHVNDSAIEIMNSNPQQVQVAGADLWRVDVYDADEYLDCDDVPFEQFWRERVVTGPDGDKSIYDWSEKLNK
jgi:hypothetical protein